MSLFSAAILIDPKGYHWTGDYSPEDGDAFDMYTNLEGGSRIEFREHIYEMDGIDFDRFETYDPFVREPALFRIFGALDPTPEAIIAFANKYGDFSTPETIEYGVDFSFGDWKEAIEEMKQAVALADNFIAAGAGKKTRKTSRDLLRLLNDVLSAAPINLSAVEKDGAFNLKMVVSELPYVLRLQLAESITQFKQYRSCEFCGKPYELTPQINRSDRVFCSDNCRVKAYQRRKRNVLAMRLDGKSLKDIVKATGSDLETVKKWFSEAQSKEK